MMNDNSISVITIDETRPKHATIMKPQLPKVVIKTEPKGKSIFKIRFRDY